MLPLITMQTVNLSIRLLFIIVIIIIIIIIIISIIIYFETRAMYANSK